jgi:hypothetical protein
MRRVNVQPPAHTAADESSTPEIKESP